MSNNQNWPDRVYAYTRNWGRADTAGRFMGFINVELSRKEDLPPNFPAVEYISAEKVREIQLTTVKATLEHCANIIWNNAETVGDAGSIVNNMNPESIIEQLKIMINFEEQGK